MSAETDLSLDEQVSMEIFGRLKMEDGILVGSIPSFHNRIEIAWKVVEEMERRGYDWEIWRGCSTRPGALFSREDGPHHPTKAATVTEAICLAALAAVRAEKEKQT